MGDGRGVLVRFWPFTNLLRGGFPSPFHIGLRNFGTGPQKHVLWVPPLATLGSVDFIVTKSSRSARFSTADRRPLCVLVLDAGLAGDVWGG